LTVRATSKWSRNSRDSGATFNTPLDGGGVVVGDKIEIEVEAVKAAAK
jgi:hypothetical protein